MAYTSFGTRKALGRRYGIDPAILLEMERLQQQYALAPGREARGMQASQFAQSLAQNESQFNQNLAMQKEANEQAGKSGMVGTLGNVATTGMLIKYMSPKTAPKVPPEVTPTVPTAEVSMSQPSPYTGMYSDTPPANLIGEGSYSTVPAYTDMVPAGAAAPAGMGTTSADIAATYAAEDAAAGSALTGGTSGSASGIGVGTVAPYVAGALLTKEAAKSSVPKPGDKQWGIGYNPAQYAANVAQHPVASVMSPTAWMTDTGLIGKDTAVGKAFGQTAKIEEKVMTAVTNFIGSIFGF